MTISILVLKGKLNGKILLLRFFFCRVYYIVQLGPGLKPRRQVFLRRGSMKSGRRIKHLSRVTRKPTFCTCENKDADQLRGNREADQRLCFRYIDSVIPLLSKSEISSLYPFSVAVQPGLCRTRSETRTLVFS